MSQKPSIMFLGSYHMSNPGKDKINFQAEDVLTPKRQREIKQLVNLLIKYGPTKIAVEYSPGKVAELEKMYLKYLSGDHELGRNEREQIGFRLAKEMRQRKVYAVDWNHKPPVDPVSIDYESFAEGNNQKAVLDESFSRLRKFIEEMNEIQREGSIADIFIFINNTETLCEMHRSYLAIAQIGKDEQYPGADWVQYWYGRNLKIFTNLIRITESDDDRILLLIGAGHIQILKQFVEDSGYFNLESPLKYIDLR
ncbi:hypothetical protein KAX75_02520 [candidate division WOR-3 bacterium]|nr:hypothetical protein [candidate division WOR-3 bacterium]